MLYLGSPESRRSMRLTVRIVADAGSALEVGAAKTDSCAPADPGNWAPVASWSDAFGVTASDSGTLGAGETTPPGTDGSGATTSGDFRLMEPRVIRTVFPASFAIPPASDRTSSN